MTEQEKKILCVELGRNIQLARQKAKITQVKFADILNLSRPSIVNIENGRQLPPLNTLIDISKALNIEIKDLLHNLSSLKPPTELEEDSKKLLESWRKSAPKTHSSINTSTIEEFLMDTNKSSHEKTD